MVYVYVCVFLQAAEMVEDEVDPDSQSWGGMRGESEAVYPHLFILFLLMLKLFASLFHCCTVHWWIS